MGVEAKHGFLKAALTAAALTAVSVTGVTIAAGQVASAVLPVLPTGLVTQIQQATTPEQINDLIAVASVGKTPDEIAQLVSIAVAAHSNFATSIVSAAAAAHPNAVNQIARAALAALPQALRVASQSSIVIAAAIAAKVPPALVNAAVNTSTVAGLSTGAVVDGVSRASATSTFSLGEFGYTASPRPGPYSGTDAAPQEPPATDPSKGNSGSPT